MMRWKTTVVLLIAVIGLGTYISRYELRQPSREERTRLARQVINLPADSVTRLMLQMPKSTLTLVRQGMSWQLSPEGLRANEELINHLVTSCAPLIAERVLSASTEPTRLDPSAYGLNPPVGRLTLSVEGTSTTLLFGERTPVQRNRYLMVEGRPEIFVVSSALFEAADQPLASFRDPLVIRFNTWHAEALTVTSPQTAFALVRHDNDWHLTQPLTDWADRSEVDQLLNRLAEMRIARFLEEAPQAEELRRWGLDHPKTEVTLVRQDQPGAPVTLSFGKPLKDEAGLLYAKRSDEPSLYAVEADDVEALLRPPNDLRARTCLDFFTGEAVKVELTREGTGWTIERRNGEWQPVSDTKLGTEAVSALVSDTVEAFLNTLANLRLVDFLEEHPQDLGRYGLEPPAAAVTVWTLNREAPRRLLVGKEVGSSAQRYGRIEGREAIVSLPATVTELLQTTLDSFHPPAEAASPQSPPDP